MTKRYETRTAIQEYVSATTCDLCSAAIANTGLDNITIERSVLPLYPDEMGGRWEFDCCPECWQNKVVPLFAANGSHPRHIET